MKTLLEAEEVPDLSSFTSQRPEGVIDALIDLLDNGSPEARSRAAEILKKIGGERVYRPLSARLMQTSREAR